MMQSAFDAASKLSAESNPARDSMFAEPPAKRRKVALEEDDHSLYRRMFPGLKQHLTEDKPAEKPEEAHDEKNHKAQESPSPDVNAAETPAEANATQPAPSRPWPSGVEQLVFGVPEQTCQQAPPVKLSPSEIPPSTPRKGYAPADMTGCSTMSNGVSKFTSLPYDMTPRKTDTLGPQQEPEAMPAVGTPSTRSTQSGNITDFAVFGNHTVPTEWQARESPPASQEQHPPAPKPLPLGNITTTPRIPRILSLSGRVPQVASSSPLSFSLPLSSAPSSPLSSPPTILFDPFGQQSYTAGPTGQEEASTHAENNRESSLSPSKSSGGFTSSQPMQALGGTSALPRMQGRDLFDQSIWKDPVKTTVFYSFITRLRQKAKEAEPTPSHHFIRQLRDCGKLVRCYTQNIDFIEEKVGLNTTLEKGPGYKGRFSRQSAGSQQLQHILQASQSPGDISDADMAKIERFSDRGVECVFLHGSLNSLRCFQCSKIADWDEADRENITLAGSQPQCPHCTDAAAARAEKGKRALGVGKLRPDIVLYGEPHPQADRIDPIVRHDIAIAPDIMLILGTSLRVDGLKRIIKEFANAIHFKSGKIIYINFTRAAESTWKDVIDFWVEMDCDGWVSDLKERKPLIWTPLQEGEKDKASVAVKEVKVEPKNPAALRPHKKNLVYYVNNILNNLAIITRKAPPGDGRLTGKVRLARKHDSPCNSSLSRGGRTDSSRARIPGLSKSGRAGSPAPQQQSSTLVLPSSQKEACRTRRASPPRGDRPEPGPESTDRLSEDKMAGFSIRDAVKSNPRQRKRKVIDGEEVVFPRLTGRTHKMPRKQKSLAASLPDHFAGDSPQEPEVPFSDTSLAAEKAGCSLPSLRANFGFVYPYMAHRHRLIIPEPAASNVQTRALKAISANGRMMPELRHRSTNKVLNHPFGFHDALLKNQLKFHPPGKLPNPTAPRAPHAHSGGHSTAHLGLWHLRPRPVFVFSPEIERRFCEGESGGTGTMQSPATARIRGKELPDAPIPSPVRLAPESRTMDESLQSINTSFASTEKGHRKSWKRSTASGTLGASAIPPQPLVMQGNQPKKKVTSIPGPVARVARMPLSPQPIFPLPESSRALPSATSRASAHKVGGPGVGERWRLVHQGRGGPVRLP